MGAGSAVAGAEDIIVPSSNQISDCLKWTILGNLIQKKELQWHRISRSDLVY